MNRISSNTQSLWPATCQWRPVLPTTVPDSLAGSESTFDQLFTCYDAAVHDQLRELQPALMCSPWAMDVMSRYPELFEGMLQQPQLGTVDYADRLNSLSLEQDEASFKAQIRQLRQQQMVRITLRDLMGWAVIQETLNSLSALATACVARADEYARHALMERFGVPRDAQGQEQRLVTLGMGKLGGGELNFSSDIDLIFIYPDSGYTDGRKQLDNQTYFIRHGQLLIRLLDEQTMDGFVFRVDMRLRPFGDSGALAVSFSAMENYYQTQGREWERYAMIKAKALTGEPEQIQRFQALLRPFVFRRYLDFSAIQSLRELKRMIDDQVQRKGMQNNIKLGRGGIREVEFIGQAFQLIYGGKNTALQQRGIVAVLQQLNADSLLKADIVDELLRAYTFLRLAENRLQMVADGQTHDLPDDELGKQRLAFSMGFDNWDDFEAVLGKYRALVAEQFADVFAESEEPKASNQWQEFWCSIGDVSDVGELSGSSLLQGLGLQDPEEHVRKLVNLRQSSAYTKATHEAQKRVDAFIPVLFEALSQLECGQDTALGKALEFMRMVMRRSIYLVLLQENPKTLQRLLEFFAKSQWMAEQLIQQPALLDQLIDTRLNTHPIPKQRP